MINKKQFTKMAKRIARSSSRLQNPRLMHPSREWWGGLLVAVVLFTGIAVWSTQTYAQYRNDAITESAVEEVRPDVYRASLVGSVLVEFTEKAELHQRLFESIDTQIEPVEDIEDIEVLSTTENTATSTATTTDSEITTEEVVESEIPSQEIENAAGIMQAPQISTGESQ